MNEGANNLLGYVGVVSTIAGSAMGLVDGVGTAASFDYPLHLALSSQGSIFVTDYNNHRIRVITSSGIRI